MYVALSSEPENTYQVYTNYAPGAKNGPHQGSHIIHRLISA